MQCFVFGALGLSVVQNRKVSTKLMCCFSSKVSWCWSKCPLYRGVHYLECPLLDVPLYFDTRLLTPGSLWPTVSPKNLYRGHRCPAMGDEETRNIMGDSLDDFITMVPPNSCTCGKNLDIMLATFARLGCQRLQESAQD